MKFRSSGVKSLKEEAVDTLRAMGSASVQTNSPPPPVQAFLGGVSAGVIALILYKFATTIEASLNRQALSDSFSVRQITITIRTIVNGLCYLPTFVFGFNSIGLFLYSGQLAMNSMMEGSTNEENKKSKGDEPLDSPNSTTESATDVTEDPLVTRELALVPLLGIDVWEYAYYLQHHDVKFNYLKNIWKVINWKYASEIYEKKCPRANNKLLVLWLGSLLNVGSGLVYMYIIINTSIFVQFVMKFCLLVMFPCISHYACDKIRFLMVFLLLIFMYRFR